MLERFAYLIKTHLPGIFPVIAYAGFTVPANSPALLADKITYISSLNSNVLRRHGMSGFNSVCYHFNYHYISKKPLKNI